MWFAFGFQGADDDSEKLSWTGQLFEAALCKLAVVSRGQLSWDCTVEPIKLPCLLQGISAWLWIDLEASWARAAGGEAAVACKRDLACLGDFLLSGAPSAAAALGGCWVDGCR